MPRFRQVYTAYYEVFVEADNMYDADEKMSNMSSDQIVSQGRLVEVDFDTSEFPEEA